MHIDHIHFYVEDAQRWQAWFVQKLGFQVLTTQTTDDTVTVHLGYRQPAAPASQPVILLRLSAPRTAQSAVAAYLAQHPAGVADLAFQVADLEAVLEQASQMGTEIMRPMQENGAGEKQATIRGWGDLQHTLIETALLESAPLSSEASGSTSTPGLIGIDHAVLNVAKGELEPAIAWYETLFGLQRRQNFTIQTEYSALCSQVLRHPQGTVQMPINEPASETSQIQEFLDWNRGAGIQHIALRACQILPLMAQLRQRGLAFLSVPASYYEQLVQRPALPLSRIEQQQIAEQEVLADWQPNHAPALLLQAFTQPIFEQPTFFFELIERRSYWLNQQPYVAEGFGEGNFRALFEAIEREQIKRGSLQR